MKDMMISSLIDAVEFWSARDEAQDLLTNSIGKVGREQGFLTPGRR